MRTPATSSNTRPDTEVVVERVLAQVVDSILIGFVTFVAAIGLIAVFYGGGSVSQELAVIVLLAPISFVYNVAFEAFRDGQTVGKRAMAIEVRSQAGNLSTKQVAIRNVPAIASPGWLIYLIGLAAIVQDPRNQRVFDGAAGTIVARA